MALVVIYCLLGLILGVIVAVVQQSMHSGVSKLNNMVCLECTEAPKVFSYILTFIKSFAKGRCSVCGAAWGGLNYVFSIMTGLQFTAIALQATSGFDMMLMCLMSLCFNFLSLNEIKGDKFWENKVCLAILLIAIIEMLMKAGPIIQMVIMPLIITMMALIIKTGIKMFMGLDGLKPVEIKVMAISSIMLPPDILAGYIMLIGGFALLWAILSKVLKGRQEVSLMPAITWATLVCLLFPKVAMIMHYMG